MAARRRRQRLPKIKAAILVHHGALDAGLVKAYPAYEAELKKNNIPYEGSHLAQLGSRLLQ